MQSRSLVFACLVLLTASAAWGQWVVRPTGTTENLYGISVRGLQGATVVGSNATILYTEDDGWDWGPQTAEPTDVDYHAVSFADHDVGLMAGTGGTILFTVNAGNLWQTIETGWMHPYYAAHQPTPLVGAVAGVNSVFQPIVGISSNGWATHDFHVFYPFHNGSNYEGTIYGVGFIDAGLGFAAVTTFDGQGAVCRTLDSGATWQTVYWSDVALYGIDVAGTEGYGVCAVGANGRIVRGGSEQWTVRPSPTNELLRGVSWDAQMNLWAVGDNGTIIHSSDNGLSWQQQESPTTENLNAVSFIWSNFAETDTGYIAGDNGIVLYTANGGASLNQPPGEFVRVTPAEDSWYGPNQMPVLMSWTESIDPDGDPITYTLRFWSTDSLYPQDSTFALTSTDTTLAFTLPWIFPWHYVMNWTVRATDGQDTVLAANGTGMFHVWVEVSADDQRGFPHAFSMSAYPNPFNPTTTLQVSLPVSSVAVMRVFDVTGRLVRETRLGRLESGSHEVAFDGSGLPSGVYFATFETPTARLTQKLVLMK